MIKILGVSISDIDIPKFVEIVLNCNKRNNKCISATGAHGLITANNNNEFYKIINSFYYNLPDGKPLVWLAKIKGATKISRCFGPNVFKEVIVKSAGSDLKHYFCGGIDGVADKLKQVCNNKFNNNQVVGTNCPPFRELKEEDIIEISNDINKKNADIVWIGISTPKQELLAYRLAKHTKVKMLITVGAAFDYHTGSLKPAPYWIQESGFEWLFRLVLEPKRLWKRYIEVIPKFLIFGFLDILGIYKNKYD